MLIIDGNHGEGGGQILRTALALSCLTGTPFRMKNIRAGREKPGMKAQHVTCVKALQTLCNAKADGAEVGSSELLFIPGKIAAKNTTLDIGTAGSVTLLLQSILLPCMFADKTHTLTLIGGTDVPFSMPIDYFAHVVLPQFARVCDFDLKIIRRGYNPAGGGEVRLTIKPRFSKNKLESLEGLRLALAHNSFSLTQQGTLFSIKGISHASNSLADRRVAERQSSAATQALSTLRAPVHIINEYHKTPSTGSGITLYAIYSSSGEITAENPVRIGADMLGEKETAAEDVGTTAAQKLIAEIKTYAPVDSHLADNLVPLIALIRNCMISVSQVTLHTRTNMWVVEQFLGPTFKEEEKIIST